MNCLLEAANLENCTLRQEIQQLKKDAEDQKGTEKTLRENIADIKRASSVEAKEIK